jgi:hypothetical protein
MEARYPGDPRARPTYGYCSVAAIGSIKRRHDDLINRAAVYWLNTNSHDTELHHVGEAIHVTPLGVRLAVGICIA